MPKGKKQKKPDDDDWENDLDAIAAEAGIDRSTTVEEDELPAVVLSKKDKKKKKQKKGADNVEDEEKGDEANGVRESQEGAKKPEQEDAVDSVEDIAEGGGDAMVVSKKPERNEEDPPKTSETSTNKSSVVVSETDQGVDQEEAHTNATAGAEADLAAPSVSLVDDEQDVQKTMKTPAQKKAEKRERDKKKKEAQKAKAKKKQGKCGDEEEEMPEEGAAVALSKITGEQAAIAPVAAASMVKLKEDTEMLVPDEALAVGEENEEEHEEDDKKKKKKKKKKTEKEKELPAGKGKGKKGHLAMVQQIREAQEKLRQEEERLKAEEEARLREEEEKERQRLEQLRLEQERKERRKQKEREKKERQRREGSYLTPAERERRAKQQRYLELLKAQGQVVGLAEQTHGGEERRKVVKYDRRKRQKPGPKVVEETQQDSNQQAPAESKTEEEEKEKETADSVSTKLTEEQEATEEKKEPEPTWEDEVKDNWDDASEDEQSDEAAESTGKQKETPQQQVEASESGKEEKASSAESSSSSSEEESSGEEESSSEEDSVEEEDKQTIADKLRARAQARIQKRREEAEQKQSTDRLRAPVVCVLGHVDTGKTKILDKLRNTKVQDGEAGGITQQIGATNVPADSIREMARHIKEFSRTELLLPGLLIIDTPGHESFSNLRSRGSSLCDIAILVVDIMHGLEPQTLESISLLRQRKTPFVVALNKIDRLYEWLRNPHQSVVNTIKKQKVHTQQEFQERAQEVVLQFAEKGLNAALFYENRDPRSYVSLIPTSAISGDGMGDLIAVIVDLSQKMLAQRLAFSEELQCHVMEVKVIGGLGTTVDVILVNGVLKEGDTMVLISLDGPFVTQARALLMPQPLKELRVKNAWVNHKEIVAAQGVKVCGKDLERALAGTQVLVAQHPDEVEILKEELAATMKAELKSIKLSEKGVYVQASTLGSLEALLEFLKTSKIPYSGVNIGPIHKKDIMKASTMLEHDEQYAVILAFDVRVERDAHEMADTLGVRIFTADIIYHLFDQFMAYREEYKRRKQEEHRHIAVFPCKLRILPNCIFNTRDPIVVGVYVESGILRPGTPLTVPSREFRDIGIISSVEANHKPKETAHAGEEVCIKVEPLPGSTPELYGRHFTHEDLLVSRISRESIDAVKNYFRDDMQKSDWHLMVELKKAFKIL